MATIPLKNSSPDGAMLLGSDVKYGPRSSGQKEYKAPPSTTPQSVEPPETVSVHEKGNYITICIRIIYKTYVIMCITIV